MNIKKLKEQAIEVEGQLKEEIEGISKFIFNNAELGGDEYLSSKFIVETMKKHGFEVSYPYCGIDTALRAEIGSEEGPVIAFLAEYDALPGYGQNGEPAHACGHNWIAANAIGTCLVLSKLKEHFKGKVVLIGTPAEETYGAKVDLIKAGAFQDIDIVFQAHLESQTNINYTTLAMDAIEFRFTGKSAHAASYPHEGINALDAVQLTFAGLNALRQHIKPEGKIHGVITNGGDAPNVVPGKASCRFYTRAGSRAYCNTLTEKLINCAKGAAIMTGATMEYGFFENSLDNLMNVPQLQELTKDNLEEIGINNFFTGENMQAASSDIGNVSSVCPTMYMEVSLDGIDDFYVHDPKALQYVNSMYAYKKLHQITKAYAGTALDLFCNSKYIDSIKTWHKVNIMEKKN